MGRAGALTLAELAMTGRPAILIPLPALDCGPASDPEPLKAPSWTVLPASRDRMVPLTTNVGASEP